MYNPYVPIKSGKNEMSNIQKKSCENCTNRDDRWCRRAEYTCIIQRQYPSEPCDENWSGWSFKPSKWDIAKVNVSNIINVVKSITKKTTKKSGLAMPDNELTNNPLDD